MKWRKGKDMFLFHDRILNILALTAGVSCLFGSTRGQRRAIVPSWGRSLPGKRFDGLHLLIGPHTPSVTVSGWLWNLPCLEPPVDGDARDAEPVS